jgi:hypothetical protein
MKKLASLVLLGACVVVPPKYGFEAHDEAGGTRVTIVSKGISLLFPKDDKPRGAQEWTNEIWRAGVVDNGYVSPDNTEVQIVLTPYASTLEEQEATLRMGCLELEVMKKQKTADGGFEIFYGCTNKNLESFFQFIRVADVNGKKIQCINGGTLAQAKAAQQICGTMEAAAPAPTTPAQQAAR